MLDVVGLDARHDPELGRQVQEGPVALVGLDDEQLTGVPGGVRPDLVHLAADDEARVQAGLDEHEGEHRRRRRLAVGAGDGDRPAQGHDRLQHRRAGKHRDPEAARLLDLDVALRHRGRVGQDVGAGDVLGPVADHDLDAAGAQALERAGELDVAAGHVDGPWRRARRRWRSCPLRPPRRRGCDVGWLRSTSGELACVTPDLRDRLDERGHPVGGVPATSCGGCVAHRGEPLRVGDQGLDELLRRSGVQSSSGSKMAAPSRPAPRRCGSGGRSARPAAGRGRSGSRSPPARPPSRPLPADGEVAGGEQGGHLLLVADEAVVETPAGRGCGPRPSPPASRLTPARFRSPATW